MRVLMFYNGEPDPDSGAAGLVFAVADELAGLGAEVSLLWKPDLKPWTRADSIYRIFESPLKLALVLLRKQWRREYDVIEISSPSSAVCWAFLSRLMVRRSGVFIFRSHGLKTQAFRRYSTLRHGLGISRPLRRRAVAFISLLQERLSVKLADGVIVPSVEDEDLATDEWRVKKDKVTVIPAGLNKAFLERKVETPPDLDVLYAGRPTIRKGINVLADAFRSVIEDRPETNLTLIGVDRRAEEFVRDLFGEECLKRMRILPWVKREEIMNEYARHKMFIFPTFSEGFSLTFLEAMAMGNVVVATRMNGMKEAIEHGVDGYLVEPWDHERISDIIIEVLENNELRGRISQRAVMKAKDYTWKKSAAKAFNFYNSIVEKKLGSGSRKCSDVTTSSK